MRYFIGVLAIVALIILGFILFGGHGGKKSPSTPVVTPKTLPDFASTTAVTRLTIDGVVNGDDAHRQIRITIGRDERTLDIIQGYQGNVIATESFPNNQNAYDVFLLAIDHEGFTDSRKSTITDYQGVCPLGDRYIFELSESGGSDFSHWSTSCDSGGTFNGQGSTIRSLFRSQITNYGQFTENVNL